MLPLEAADVCGPAVSKGIGFGPTFVTLPEVITVSRRTVLKGKKIPGLY
jgi:hypothetical protein